VKETIIIYPTLPFDITLYDAGLVVTRFPFQPTNYTLILQIHYNYYYFPKYTRRREKNHKKKGNTHVGDLFCTDNVM